MTADEFHERTMACADTLAAKMADMLAQYEQDIKTLARRAAEEGISLRYVMLTLDAARARALGKAFLS